MPARSYWMFFACVLVASTSFAAEPEEPTLNEQLEELSEQSKQRVPEPMLRTFQQAIEEVRESGIEDKAMQVDDKAPDATLESWDGKKVTLSDLWKEKPLVLVWYRGGWCPYCNLQLRAMQKKLEALGGAGGQLVAISPELPENAKKTAEQNKLSFPVLWDKESKIGKEYGIVFELPDAIAPMYRDRLQLPKVNGYEKLELPLSATYVIDRDGVIRHAFLDADYTKRAEPQQIIDMVERLSKPQP
ncbi:peroxiredoxin-like family protein [Aeoliella sp. SH292]|uniref:peroxiredoxin-like family protein n=1 Tax=Aeoliella sp. SH292 TaxID=3454464 RepID=UPI003F9DFC70